MEIWGGWMRRRYSVAFVTVASNWYWLTIGQGLLSLQQVRVEGEWCCFFYSFTFTSFPSFFPLPLFHLLYYLFYHFPWETTQNDPQVLTCRKTPPQSISWWRLIMKLFLLLPFPFRWFKKGSCLVQEEVLDIPLMHNAQKRPYTVCGQRRSRSACASVQSDLNILCSATYTTVSIDSVSGQWRSWSACAYAQADLDLHCPQIA